jgi:hypothetical protein
MIDKMIDKVIKRKPAMFSPARIKENLASDITCQCIMLARGVQVGGTSNCALIFIINKLISTRLMQMS